jgi:hypothetical protein
VLFVFTIGINLPAGASTPYLEKKARRKGLALA